MFLMEYAVIGIGCGFCDFFCASRRRHTRCALVTGVQTCALPISCAGGAMNAVEYQSFADAWESRATIRTRPRRRVEDDDKLIFPMSRQPLVHSQTFLRHCPQLRDFVLVQSLYK